MSIKKLKNYPRNIGLGRIIYIIYMLSGFLQCLQNATYNVDFKMIYVIFVDESCLYNGHTCLQVELYNEVEARVNVLDSKGQPLLKSYFALMRLRLVSGSDIISIRSGLFLSSNSSFIS